MPKIDFNRDNFNQCLCGNCPVQRNSPCVQAKEQLFAPLKAAIQEQARMPDPPQIVPGVYCSQAVGKSECEDLNKTKACLCPACPVTINLGLVGDYYCVRGSADQVG